MPSREHLCSQTLQTHTDVQIHRGTTHMNVRQCTDSQSNTQLTTNEKIRGKIHSEFREAVFISALVWLFWHKWTWRPETVHAGGTALWWWWWWWRWGGVKEVKKANYRTLKVCRLKLADTSQWDQVCWIYLMIRLCPPHSCREKLIHRVAWVKIIY